MRMLKTDEDVPHSTAEMCLNLWYFTDFTGIAVRIAVKAYALRGSDVTLIDLRVRLSRPGVFVGGVLVR